MSSQRGGGFFLLLLTLLVSFSGAHEDQRAEESSIKREGKAVSLFQIVRFPNDPCDGGSNNGTCYTEAECNSRGGTNSGTCAAGYGVCCIFTANCGATSSENSTYFESTGSEGGSCKLTICPCNSNICQLRLDFTNFQITGPSTSTVVNAQILNGQPTTTAAAGVAATTATRCLTDTFSVTNPNGKSPSTICGKNTGQHMYVDASALCNDLTFTLGNTGIGAAIGTRQWNIRITQFSCDYPNLAPEGCTQYYFGATVDSVQTYNYDGNYHLADQDQNICVRRERGNCRICWTTQANSDFRVSGVIDNVGVATAQSKCCGYGADGVMLNGGDCAIIPGALKAAATTVQGFPRICGRNAGLVTSAAGTTAKTVCSRRTPFSIRFLSDSFEFAAEALITNENGFKLTYIQNNNNC